MAISNLFNLFGRTALVTDSSRYLSKAIALHLAESSEPH